MVDVMDVIHLVECVAISMMEETKARVRQNFSVQFSRWLICLTYY